MKNLWARFGRLFTLYVLKGSVVLVFLIGVIFVVVLLQNYNNDTTRITNAAFAITASLASICFACARSLNSDDQDRDKFTYSGERFMHASILLITASLIKYAIISLRSMHAGRIGSVLIEVIVFPLGICVVPLFMFALSSAHTGLKICSDLLWARMLRYPGWDRLF